MICVRLKEMRKALGMLQEDVVKRQDVNQNAILALKEEQEEVLASY